MSHPYPVEQLRRLTPRGVATLQELNDRDETKLAELRASRAEVVAEVASIDEVMADLHETIGRRQSKMRGDMISLLPSDVRVAPSPDARAHAETWNGPQTGMFAPTPAHAEQPAGFCINCGQPVWRAPVTEATPKGYQHGFGATCNPEDQDGTVADLGDQEPES